mgnify:CR=1 FL=1
MAALIDTPMESITPISAWMPKGKSKTASASRLAPMDRKLTKAAISESR